MSVSWSCTFIGEPDTSAGWMGREVTFVNHVPAAADVSGATHSNPGTHSQRRLRWLATAVWVGGKSFAVIAWPAAMVTWHFTELRCVTSRTPLLLLHFGEELISHQKPKMWNTKSWQHCCLCAQCCNLFNPIRLEWNVRPSNLSTGGVKIPCSIPVWCSARIFYWTSCLMGTIPT